MRVGFFIVLLLAVCLSNFGQAANQTFPTNTTAGNENDYLTGTKASQLYQGVAGFIFETSHDAATIYFQGCYDTDDWRDIDTVTASGAGVVDQIVSQSPPLYERYRLWIDGNAGDTCIILNARYFLKY